MRTVRHRMRADRGWVRARTRADIRTVRTMRHRRMRADIGGWVRAVRAMRHRRMGKTRRLGEDNET